MATKKWALDIPHSELNFKVRHMMVSNVSGHFKTLAGTAETDGDDVATARVHFTADVNSISTNNEQRDGHLKTGDFFDAENHPQIIFDASGLTKVKGEDYTMTGTLNMRGTSKEITINVEYGGMIVDPWGQNRVGFSVSGKVNRKDFGVNFSMVSETGGILLGDDVSFTGNVEFVQAAETAA